MHCALPSTERLNDASFTCLCGEAGGEMPTRAPNMNSCGTKSPIWMSGSHHPFIEEGALNRTACAKLFYFIELRQHQRFCKCSVFLYLLIERTYQV